MATNSAIDQQSIRNTSCFSDQSFNRLKSIMYEMKAEAGTHLFWEGDVADKLFYIIHGRVKITKSSDEGRQFILYMYQNGDLFGQLDPYQDSLQGFNAEVVEETTVGIIQKKDLEVLLWQHGDLAVEFMKWMGLVHRMTQTKFRDLMMFGKSGALCSTLIRLTNSYGEPRGGHILINKRLTNTELADMIGATRESVNRMLADLKHAEIIKNENGYITITNMEMLKNTCHCENCPIDICRI